MNLPWNKKKKELWEVKKVEIMCRNLFKKNGCEVKEREWIVMMLSWSGGWRMEEGFEHVCKFQRQNQQLRRDLRWDTRGDNSKTQVQRDGRQWGWAYGWRQEHWMVARLLPCENVGGQTGRGLYRGELRHMRARSWGYLYLTVPIIVLVCPLYILWVWWEAYLGEKGKK